MEITERVRESGGWEAPFDCEVSVTSQWGGEPTTIRMSKGQCLAFPIDTRPIPHGAAPRRLFERLELDGTVVWRNPSHGSVRVKLHLLPPSHPGTGFFGEGESPAE